MNSKDKISKVGVQRDYDGVVFEMRSRRKISMGQENCFPSNSQASLPVVMSDITTSKIATELIAPVVHHFARTPLIHGVTYNHNLYPAASSSLILNDSYKT
ncbi:uncharacterized protein G2W53_033096 [Senna tora]|uniref:Uncharacterized protein n=1 Tax=Senna tora TaxID=362788 RepID=A0A834W6S8_9FABA|nr:uncharacterized protein G2W53_033096 [Senna tora]